MSRRRDSDVEEMENVRINNDIITHPQFFDFVLSVMNSENEVDVETLTESFDEECVRTRRQGKKDLKYIPSKFVKERLNDVLGCKWSFFPLREERVSDPLPRYDKDDDSYTESDNYIKVTGCLVIPGLGVQVATGVKRTYGYGEADDWKAAGTDAFKKCCSMFGIEADYEIEDSVDGDYGPATNIDLDDIEYDDDELNEALETQVTFGKFKNLTLDEIYDEDPTYIEWLVENAREEDMQMNAAIVLKYYTEEDAKKKKSTKKTTAKSGSKKSSGKSSSSSRNNKSSSKKSSGVKKSSTSRKKDDDDDEEVDDEKAELIENIEEIFEEEGYDNVTQKQIIQSVSVTKNKPRGKSKLSELSVKELTALLNVLVEDEEDDEDEE